MIIEMTLRAEYDVKKRKILPPIETWEKHCLCKTPFNPDYMYVQCDKCLEWFHIHCVNLIQEQLDSLGDWCCPKCAEAKVNRNFAS